MPSYPQETWFLQLSVQRTSGQLSSALDIWEPEEGEEDPILQSLSVQNKRKRPNVEQTTKYRTKELLVVFFQKKQTIFRRRTWKLEMSLFLVFGSTTLFIRCFYRKLGFAKYCHFSTRRNFFNLFSKKRCRQRVSFLNVQFYFFWKIFFPSSMGKKASFCTKWHSNRQQTSV